MLCRVSRPTPKRGVTMRRLHTREKADRGFEEERALDRGHGDFWMMGLKRLFEALTKLRRGHARNASAQSSGVGICIVESAFSERYFDYQM